MANQSMQIRSEITYEKGKENVSGDCLDFQFLIRLGKLLTLKENQHLYSEMADGDKFDDVVVWDGNENLYYLLQSKRKDNAQANKISWKSWFPNAAAEKTFNLWHYFASFLNVRKQKRFQDSSSSSNNLLIKELTLATNVGFDTDGRGSLMPYLLEETSEMWRDLSEGTQAKRFRITRDTNLRIPIEKEIKNKFPNEDPKEINRYLDLLAFEVEFPDVPEQREKIKEELVSQLPFQLSEDEAKQAADFLETKEKELFKQMPTKQKAMAVSLQDRQNLLSKIILEMKDKLLLGSTRGYETTLLKIVESDHEITFSSKEEEDFKKGLSIGCLNIVAAPDKSNPNLASCKVLSYFKRLAKSGDQDPCWIVDVKSEVDGERLASIFADPKVALCRGWTFVIEFDRKLCLENKTSQLVNRHCSNRNVGDMFKVVFITSRPIEQDNDKIKGVIIDEFSLKCFPIDKRDGIKRSLQRKSLNIKNGRTTSLEEMGIDINTLDSLALAELVLYDATTHQIDLQLPAIDEEFERIYVPRQLKIPVVSERNLSRLLPDKSELGKNSSCSLLSMPNLSSMDISHPKSKELYFETAPVGEEMLIDRNSTLLSKSTSGVKTAVVVDLPGMGKSSLFTHLGNDLLKELRYASGDHRIVLRINLGSCSSDTWEKPMDKGTDVIHFLIQTKPTTGIMFALSNTILERILWGNSSWKVVLLLDGFDEIGKEGVEFVEKLVNLLLNSKKDTQDATLKGIERILMASRPDGSTHQRLEKMFNQFAIRLAELDLSNQEKLLVAFWSERGGIAISQETTERCNEFAGALINQVKQQLNDEEGLVLAIPLQCMLLAEVFYEDLKNHIESEEQTEPSNKLVEENFDILALFDTFLDRKFEIWNREKKRETTGTNDVAQDAYKKLKDERLRELQQLSVFYMIESKERAELITDRWIKTIFDEKLQNAKALGLIAYSTEDNDKSPTDLPPRFGFIHRTFAEYFMAKQLYFIFQKDDVLLKKSEPCKLIDEIVVMNNEFEGVRRFFMQLIKPLLHVFVREGLPVHMIHDPPVAIEKWPGIGSLPSFSQQYFTFLLKVFKKF